MTELVFKTNVIDFYNEIKDRLHSLNNRSRKDLRNNLNGGQRVVNNIRTTLNIFNSKMEGIPAFFRMQWISFFLLGYLFFCGIEFTNNGNNPKAHTNRNNRTIHRFNLNRYNQHNRKHNTQHNHSNANGLGNNNGYQCQYNNSNDGNGNTTDHSYNAGQYFTNNFPNLSRTHGYKYSKKLGKNY